MVLDRLCSRFPQLEKKGMSKWLTVAKHPVAQALARRLVIAALGALFGLLADVGLLGGEASDLLERALSTLS